MQPYKNQDTRTELTLHDGGLWPSAAPARPSSTSAASLELDTRQLLRHRRGTSPALPHADQWVRLIPITSPRGDHTIRVGDRHEYLTNPDGDHHDHRWYIPRACINIEQITEGALPEQARRTVPPRARTPSDPA